MGLSDVLPDRPLTDGEFEELQNSDTFDHVHTGESGRIETLVIEMDGSEYMLHFTPDNGWHKHEH